MSKPAILIDCEESHTQLDVNLIKICRKQYCVHVFGPANKLNQLKQHFYDKHITFHEKAERSQPTSTERSNFPATIWRLFKRKLHSYRSIKRDACTFKDMLKRHRINSVIISTASSIYYLGLTEILDKPAYKQEKGDKRKDKSAKKTKHPLQ